MKIPLDIDDLIVYIGGVIGLGFFYRKSILSLPRRIKSWWRGLIWNQFWKLGLISKLQIGGHCGCCGAWVPDVITDKSEGFFGGWTLCKKCSGEVS